MALFNQTGQQIQQGQEAPKIEFPCDNYLIKIVALDHDDTHETVITCVRRHAPEVDETQISTKRSGKGTFVSFSYRILAHSENQLSSLHKDLMALPAVKMVM
ncbi:DUF493 domain-containing protein [Maribrevibacterium harenarium]|uniref:UPF0250 protein FJM67_12875 n=1 Tax=Maribrevibacterium harenarium TaxID=2589817 RepID=A0A501WKQ7_9GAMM|nr:DUF493 domain-containing protein [Maribrevibacterium harenarium]TPE48724.1 DUF493 domain-containing protein [Maribrevibacterium harenarium]